MASSHLRISPPIYIWTSVVMLICFTISAIIFLRFLLLLLVKMMSRTKKTKVRRIAEVNDIKRKPQQWSNKFATITLFEIRTTAWLGFLKSQLLNWILSVGKGIKNMRKLCTLSISRGGGGEFFYPIKGPRKIFPRSTSSSENNTWFYFFSCILLTIIQLS